MVASAIRGERGCATLRTRNSAKPPSYGVYDIGANAGWVSVGIKGNTAQFAVASIRRLLDVLGREHYPDARELTITVDGGGLNLLRLVDSCRRP